MGTPPRTLYPYPASLLRFPYSPPTPSSLGLPPSPWSYGSRSISVSSSVATPGPPSNQSLGGDVMQNTGSSNDTLVTSTPKADTDSAGARNSAAPNTTPDRVQGLGLMTGIIPGTWLVNAPGSTPAIQTKPHLKPSHPGGPYAVIQSPLGLGQAPYSPALQSLSYPGSVSSCPSVSSSSGCSSASENHYILSEYHVGPHRFINEKDMDNQSEEATTSGRNTPVDPITAEDNGNCVLASK